MILDSEHLNSTQFQPKAPSQHPSRVRKRQKHPAVCWNNKSEHIPVLGHINSLFLEQIPAWFLLACLLTWSFRSSMSSPSPKMFKNRKSIEDRNCDLLYNIKHLFFASWRISCQYYIWCWTLLSILHLPARPECSIPKDHIWPLFHCMQQEIKEVHANTPIKEDICRTQILGSFLLLKKPAIMLCISECHL